MIYFIKLYSPFVLLGMAGGERTPPGTGGAGREGTGAPANNNKNNNFYFHFMEIH